MSDRYKVVDVAHGALEPVNCFVAQHGRASDRLSVVLSQRGGDR